jgi:glycosyltransferase involved in cell wall biosynthesis
MVSVTQNSIGQKKQPQHKRLLFVTNSARYFYHHRIRLANFAQKKGYTVGVITVTDSKEHRKKIENSNIEYFEIFLKRNSLNPFKEFLTILRIASFIIRFKPSVIHSLTIKAVIYSGILCRILGVPMVGLIPGRGAAFTTKGLKGFFLKKLATHMYRIALKKNTICPCFENNEDLQFFRNEKIISATDGERIFGAGVDVSSFKPNPSSLEIIQNEDKHEKKLFVLMACRLLRDKGVLEFLNAARIVQNTLPHVEFQLAGATDPQNPNSLSPQEVDQLCLVHGVNNLGFQEDMKPVLENCNVFCLPTYYGEGVPVSILEAMSMQRAVVTTTMPGCKDAVVNGVNGYLVEPKNAEMLADAILKICIDEKLCLKMGVEGRKRVEKYFKDSKVHQKFLSVYNSLENLKSA